MNAKEISGMEPGSRAAVQKLLQAASVGNRAPDDRRNDERTRSLSAKSDDDVGPPRAMREQQAQTKL